MDETSRFVRPYRQHARGEESGISYVTDSEAARMRDAVAELFGDMSRF